MKLSLVYRYVRVSAIPMVLWYGSMVWFYGSMICLVYRTFDAPIQHSQRLVILSYFPSLIRRINVIIRLGVHISTRYTIGKFAVVIGERVMDGLRRDIPRGERKRVCV